MIWDAIEPIMTSQFWFWYTCGDLSGDPAHDGHDAEVNVRVAQIRELLRVRDGLDHICESIESDHAG